jgi:alpha-1,3-glucosyltransferase
VTSLSFLLLFSPWLPPFTSLSSILIPIGRIFPFNRGLFEDKVANFWCASDVVLKWRRWISKDTLVRLSAVLTAIGFTPAVIGMMYSGWALSGRAREDRTTARPPMLQLLPYALLTSSMSFFLFSFQVHEKTILLPLMPLTLLLSGSAPDSATFEMGVLANNVAVFRLVFSEHLK